MEILPLLERGIKENASDLHLSPNQLPRLRLAGELIPLSHTDILTADTLRHAIYNLMTIDQQHILAKYFEIDFALSISDAVHCRVHAFHQAQGLAAVFRIIPKTPPTLAQLALPPIFTTLSTLSHGLILLTGATGCGKSTTIAALINEINHQRPHHIITLEDPIEFIHTSKKGLVSQRQIHRDTQDFTSALRSALRQDPDVILVGEMRDLNTAKLALMAAETGHLVMATLHASSAPRAIHRLIDIFPAGEKNKIRNMLSESLQAVIYQTLIKNIHGKRSPAFEIMLGTPPIRNLIREDKITQMYSIMQTHAHVGMCTLDQYLENLIRTDIISSTIARNTAVHKDIFEMM